MFLLCLLINVKQLRLLLSADSVETPLKCRLAAKGNDRKYMKLTEGTETYSHTCSEDDSVFTLAAMQAYSESRGEKTGISMFDTGGAFCRVKTTSSLRLFLELPHNLPHPLAGCFLEVFAALYGLKESSRMFSLDVSECLAQDGFVQCVASPSTFLVADPVECGKKAFTTVHVDDFRVCHNDAPSLAEKLRLCLFRRYGDVTDCSSKPYCGVQHTVLPSGAVLLTQDQYIQLVAGRVGVAHMTPVKCPGDYQKAINTLLYLHSTPGVGPVFKSSTIQRFVYADAAFADQENGSSSGAHFQCFGEFGAPFSTNAKVQADVAVNPMTAEYFSASGAVQSISHFSQFAEELGVPQVGPVTLTLDCQTDTNLVYAPEVTKKSRHMHAKHHYTRQAKERDVISIKHVTSPFMRSDNITKVFSNSVFKSGRDSMLNRKATLEL